MEKKWRQYITDGAGQEWASIWETWRRIEDTIYCKTTPERSGILLYKEEMPGRRKEYEISCEMKSANNEPLRGSLVFSYRNKEKYILLEAYLRSDSPVLRLVARNNGKWSLLHIAPIKKKYIKKGWNRIFLNWNELGLSFGINKYKTYVRGFNLPKKWQCGLGLVNSACYFKNFKIK